MNINEPISKENKLSFGISGIGRNISYSVVTQSMLLFLGLQMGLSQSQLIIATVIIVAARLFDAFTDPVVGLIVDNTRTKWGKSKPWILIGGIGCVIFFCLLFIDVGLRDTPYLVFFTIIYLLWGIAYTFNDTSYWGILPALTVDRVQRQKLTTFTNIFAGLGMFLAIIVPPFLISPDVLGVQNGFFVVAIITSVIFIASQVLVLVGVKPKYNAITDSSKQEKLSLKEVFRSIGKNKMLLIVTVALTLYQVGYFITNGLGLPYFWFNMGDYGGSGFMIFGAVLGVAQAAGLLTYNVLAKKYSRKTIYAFSMILMAVGYAMFFLIGQDFVLPANIVLVGIAGLLAFYAQALILVMLMVMMSETVEYGQYVSGIRTETTVFAVRTLIAKFAGAVQTGVVTAVWILSGVYNMILDIQAMERDRTAETEVIRDNISKVMAGDPAIEWWIKIAMIVVPMILMGASYVVYKKWYTLDEAKYDSMIAELAEREGGDTP
jgi:melibiose permease/lactose/raffinose/galactose permease